MSGHPVQKQDVVHVHAAVIMAHCHFTPLAHHQPRSGAGAAASDHERALQQSLLKQVLVESAADVPPQLLADTAVVLMSSTLPSNSMLTVSASTWMQEDEDRSLQQRQLNALVRGQSCSAVVSAAACSKCREASMHVLNPGVMTFDM